MDTLWQLAGMSPGAKLIVVLQIIIGAAVVRGLAVVSAKVDRLTHLIDPDDDRE